MSTNTNAEATASHPDVTTVTSVPTLAMDGKTYELDKLSEAARQQVANIRMADMELGRLQMQQALVQTARNAYVQVLTGELKKVAE